MYNDKLPPQDLAAEEAVLGSLLIDPEAIFNIATLLRPDDLYRDKNRWLYESCLSLYDRDEPINQITVAHELARQQKLEAVGGAAYLSHLVSQVPTSVYVEHYAQIVHQLALMRQLISAGSEITAIGYEAGTEADAALNKAEDILFRLRRAEGPRDFIHIREIMDRYFEESSLAPKSKDGHLPHVPTGFKSLDDILGGLQRSDMIVLAARPSVGKTSLALNIARNAALDYKARVAIFSLEMSKMELAYRFLSSESGIDTQRVRLDQLSDGQRGAIMDAMGTLSAAHIYIDDSPFLTERDMRSKARRLYNEKGLDLIMVDYIQLMRSGRRHDNRVQEMSEISHSIKGLSRELDLPLLAVSQLSRAVESRSPHRPLLSDLRESGDIEQDADVVLFIYRDDVYYTEEEWEKLNPQKPYPKGDAEIIVAKHRSGPTGEIRLFFQKRIAKFEPKPITRTKPSLL